MTGYSAAVEWVMPYLAYTQEQYTVNYGTSSGSLDQSSIAISSTSDVSAANLTYSVSIQDLTPNTVYYFQLSSMNTRGAIVSSVMTFTTSEAGKLLA